MDWRFSSGVLLLSLTLLLLPLAPEILVRFGGSVPADLGGYYADTRMHNCVFYSRETGRFWVFYRNGITSLVYRSSADGSDWTDPGVVNLPSGVQLIYSVSAWHSGPYVHLVCAYCGSDAYPHLVYLHGSLGRDGTASFGEPVEVARAEEGVLCVDAENYVWISYPDPNSPNLIVNRSSSPGPWLPGGTSVSLGQFSFSDGNYIRPMVPLPGGGVALFVNDWGSDEGVGFLFCFVTVSPDGGVQVSYRLSTVPFYEGGESTLTEMGGRLFVAQPRLLIDERVYRIHVLELVGEFPVVRHTVTYSHNNSIYYYYLPASLSSLETGGMVLLYVEPSEPGGDPDTVAMLKSWDGLSWGENEVVLKLGEPIVFVMSPPSSEAGNLPVLVGTEDSLYFLNLTPRVEAPPTPPSPPPAPPVAVVQRVSPPFAFVYGDQLRVKLTDAYGGPLPEGTVVLVDGARASRDGVYWSVPLGQYTAGSRVLVEVVLPTGERYSFEASVEEMAPVAPKPPLGGLALLAMLFIPAAAGVALLRSGK